MYKKLSLAFILCCSWFLTYEESLCSNVYASKAYQDAIQCVMDTQRRIEKIHVEDFLHHPERVQQDDVFTKGYLEGIEYAKNAMKGFQEKSFFETFPSEDHENSEDLEDLQEAFSNLDVEDEERFLRLQLERENVHSPRTIESIIAVAKNEQYKDFKPSLGSFRGFEDDFSLYENPEDVARIAYVEKQAQLAKVYLKKQERGQTLTEYEKRVVREYSYFMQGEVTHVVQMGIRGTAIAATLLQLEMAGPIWSVAEGLNGALDGLNGCHYAPSSLRDMADIGVHSALGSSLAKGSGSMLKTGAAAAAYGYATNNPDLMHKGSVTFSLGGMIKTIPIITQWMKSEKTLGGVDKVLTQRILPQNAHHLDRLNTQLVAEDVVSWHGTEKHLHEFEHLGIQTPEQLKLHVETVLQSRETLVCKEVGKTLYAHPSTKTIIVQKTAAGIGEPTLFIAKDFESFVSLHTFVQGFIK